ncbi:hypothetical protein Anas_11813 [Armadillidium nasatum]|uniref:Uncharacterized protein n=1 Tax=Armadillidium nasatum TaxID=96803 RepID=A0A5N5TDU8_9CRUS|nr:hypothetical protein Anas_11813 [Armadillidium nasatum]
MYKYLNCLLQNISEENKTVSSEVQLVLDIFILFQILPLHAMCCKSFLVASTEADALPKKETYEKWRENSIQETFGNYEQNLKLKNLLELNLEKLSQDSQTIEEQSTSRLLEFSSVLNHLNITCAQYLLQTIIFLLNWKTKMKLSVDCDPRFNLHVISVLKSIIERFERVSKECQNIGGGKMSEEMKGGPSSIWIKVKQHGSAFSFRGLWFDVDWEKCQELSSLHISLCKTVRIHGVDTRVKIVSFQTIKSCIDKSLYSWKFSETKDSSPLDLEKLKEDYYCYLLQTTNTYLSDIEWEVRDSALEVIWSLMNVENSELELFCICFEKFNILNLVLQAVGDIEQYVQSSALNVLSAVISIDKIWGRMNEREIKQKALRSVVKSGEASIRKSGLNLLRSLLINSKFHDSDDDVRLSSVVILRHILFFELERIGIQDTNKITSECSFTSYAEFRFTTEEMENKILGILTRFCQNGCFQCILNSVDDNVKTISSEAQYICKYVSLLVNKYSLLDKLASSLRKLKNKENGKVFWWNYQPEEDDLRLEDIPFESMHIDEKWILDVIENGPQVKSGDENSLEKEMHLLLEDVFLVMSTHSENESRAQDCY